MKLDLSIDYDLGRFKAYCNKLIKQGAQVDLTKVLKKRSIDQNSYLHVCIALYCDHTGYTKKEGKSVLKRSFGSFMIYEKKGTRFLESSADLSTLEMTEFIEWIRNIACYENLGVYVPTPEEYIENQFQIDKQIEKVK